MLAATLRPVRGNDSAASTAAGGIQLKCEPRILMAKEKLTIGTEKVTVEYEFINESDQDITTEVAFPIPPYEVTMSAGGIRDFNDFRLWVEGVQQQYKVDTKAYLRSKDYTALLLKYGIDITSLGHYEDREHPLSLDFRKLAKPVQNELLKVGLFDGEENLPAWTVAKTYYWTQTFPSHKLVHVRHEYEPGIGFELMNTSLLAANPPGAKPQTPRAAAAIRQSPEDEAIIDSACLGPKLRKTLIEAGKKYEFIGVQWIDYIVTTANSWKTPIKDFELVLEKPELKDKNFHDI